MKQTCIAEGLTLQVASVSDRIEEALAVRGMRAIDLAQKSGISKASISGYILGKYEPKQDALRKMALALGVTEMWLAGYDEPMERAKGTQMVSAADRIEEALALRGMKAVELAELSGINKSSISCYITRRYEPKQDALHKMSAVLNVAEMWLAGYDVPMMRSSKESHDYAPPESESTLYIQKHEKPVASVSERLIEATTVTGKKQIDLVRETGIDSGAMSCYFTGKYEPKQLAINKLALALGVSELWLSGYDVPMMQKQEGECLDKLAAIIEKMKTDKVYFQLIYEMSGLSNEQIETASKIIKAITDIDK